MVVSSARIFSPLQPSALGDRQLSSLQKTMACLDCGGLGYRGEQVQVACSLQVKSAASSVCTTHPPWCSRCLLLFYPLLISQSRQCLPFHKQPPQVAVKLPPEPFNAQAYQRVFSLSFIFKWPAFFVHTFVTIWESKQKGSSISCCLNFPSEPTWKGLKPF